MRFADVLRLSLSALWQQKVRTLLTVSGIVTLTLALTISVSVEEGFRQEVERQLRHGDQLRQVWVFPGTVPLTEPTVAQLRALPHVESVAPMGSKVCDVSLTRDHLRGEQVASAVALAAAPQGPGPLRALAPLVPWDRQAIVFVARPNDEHLRDRIIAGRYLSSADANEVLVAKDLVHELALDRGQPPEWLVGQKLKVVYPSQFRSDMEMNRVLRLVDQVLTPSESQVVRKLLLRVRDLGDRAPSVLTARERDTLETILRRELEEPSASVASKTGPGPGKEPAPGKEPPVAGKGPVLTGKDDDERAVLAKVRKEIEAARDEIKFTDADRDALERVLRRYVGEPRAAAGAGPLFEEELTIVGVLRDYEQDRDWNWGLHLAAQTDKIDLFLSPATTERLYGRNPSLKEVGHVGVFITVDDDRNMREVVAAVEKLGLRERSLLEFVDEFQGGMALVTFLTSFLVLLVSLAAVLGSTNIMFMSVLERTHEIGVMKAVGARQRHVQLLFLVEGTLVGVFGGALGVLGAWLTTFPADAYARQMMRQYAFAKQLTHSPFAFPWWLVLGVPLFTTLVAILGAVLPARRAARVDPIQALRHE